MSVGSDSTIHPEHYGSAVAMTDYESKVHNVYFTLSYNASAKLNLFGSINYNISEAALDVVNMEADLTHLPNQDADFTLMNTYSDLDYKMLELGGGFSYKLSPQVTLQVDGEYDDLTDDAGYVYGNESGSYFVIRSGIKINF